MVRTIVALIMLTAYMPLQSRAQETAAFKGFNQYKSKVEGIDFFARSRQLVTPYENPLSETHQKMVDILGPDLPKGAIFICSSLKESDSVWEPGIIKLGYSWVLTDLTAEARAEETMERMKSRMGGEISADMLEMIKSRMADSGDQIAASMAQSKAREMAMAILQTKFAPDKSYRISRVDDAGRSPLPDWLDIGIANYAAGGDPNAAFLQQRIEEAFPLEDVLAMYRPFVAPSTGGSSSGGGGGMSRGGFSPGGMPPSGGMPSAGGMPQGGGGMRGGGGNRMLPKDQQDRMLFDSEASAFFQYLIEKLSLDKIKALIQFASEGNESYDWIVGKEAFGSSIDQIEEEWLAWLQEQKEDGRSGDRPPSASGRPENPSGASGE